MRLGFNALFLGRPWSGSGQYIHNLLRGLLELAGSNDYVLHVPEESDFELPGFSNDLRVLSNPFTQRSENLAKLWFEQVAFPSACRRSSLDLAHVPYFAPPLYPPVPIVVTIHDVIPLLLPAYRGSIRVRLYMRLVSAAARRADMVITDSQHSKKDIVEHLHLPAERVRVIYLAADPACQPVTDESALCAVRRRYGLPEDYLLYLGGFDKRKNLPTLMTAYARAQEAMSGEAPPLAVAGRLPEVETALFPDPRRIAEELHIEHSVVFTGWIAEEDKPAVYGGALFFVSLSLYEGFGLMPLESMSCGTPVLVGRTSSLPEVVGPGGLLVDPMNMDEVVDAMVALIQDPLQRSRLAAAALVQASRFRWEATAEQTLQVYEHVLRGSAANATPVPGAGGHFS